jgi:hypothetical protein
VDLPLGLALLRGHRLGEPPEQGHHDCDVLASPGELWKVVAVFHNLPVNVADPGSCVLALSAALCDLTLEPSAFFLQAATCFLKLTLSCLQLL